MENSSDKQIREKLSSTEFPFDPQAWEQMEAMLGEKKKRSGFFWWWTGGIAAVLLLSIGILGWGVYLMDEDDKQVVEITDGRLQTAVNTTEAADNDKAKVKSEKLKVSAAAKKSEIGNHVSSNNSEQAKAEVNTSTVASSKWQMAKDKNSSALISENPNKLPNGEQGPHRTHSNAFSKKKSKKTSAYKTTTVNSNHIPATENPLKKEVEMLNVVAAKNALAENILLARRESELLQSVSDKAETGFDKKEEDALPKKKKPIFHYSLGVLANVTGTTLGSQTFSNNPRNRPLPFYSTPSYMVGFTHDFLFVNRIAITNSILFSQTSFKVYNPKTLEFSKTPTEYTSHITELAIPIGIKVYAVVKSNFRFYINTGIINHIKLKETFDYTFAPDTSTSFVASFADNAAFPMETNFAGGGTTFNRSASGNSNSTQDFSINNAKRYYASFYASAGFEFIAKKHFILFAEPTFHMSLQKIGVQEKRKYNLGLSGGFRYQF